MTEEKAVKIRMTPERQKIIDMIKSGETLMMTRDSSDRRVCVHTIGGKNLSDVASRMVAAGILVPNSDGLFAGSGQTLRLSDKYKD